MIEYLINHAPIILLLVYLVDKLLESIPSIRSNNVFQLLSDIVKRQVLKNKTELQKLLPEEGI